MGDHGSYLWLQLREFLHGTVGRFIALCDDGVALAQDNPGAHARFARSGDLEHVVGEEQPLACGDLLGFGNSRVTLGDGLGTGIRGIVVVHKERVDILWLTRSVREQQLLRSDRAGRVDENLLSGVFPAVQRGEDVGK